MKTRPALTLDDCKKISAAAEAEAQKNNWEVAIVILDDGGHVLHALRSDGAGGKLHRIVDPVGAPGQAEGLLDGEQPRFSREGRGGGQGQSHGEHGSSACMRHSQHKTTARNHGESLRSPTGFRVMG